MGKDRTIYGKPVGSSSYAAISMEDYLAALTTPGAVAHGVANILGKQYEAGSILLQIDGSSPIETSTTSNVPDVYEVALVGAGTAGSPTPPLKKWDSLVFTPRKPNTGAATLTVSDWGVTAAIKHNGQDLEPNELVVGFEYRLVWTGAVWELGLIDESLEIRNKGSFSAVGNPLIPAGQAGDQYYIEAAGKIGGGAGHEVAIGDVIVYRQDTAGGTAAQVGDAIAIETFGTAQAAAEAAAGSATAAAASATAANTAKTEAEAAQAAAESWRNQAEGYKEDAAAHELGASAANTDAQAAKVAAEGYANNALDYRNDAQVAKDQSQSAANDAGNSALNALQYKNDAETAQAAAANAASNAQSAAGDAAGYSLSASNSNTSAGSAKDQAEAAKIAAETAASNAGSSANDAFLYLTNSEAAKVAAEAARDAAIAAGGEIRRVRVPYTLFNYAQDDISVPIDTLPAGSVVEFLQLKRNEPFTGGSISAVDVKFSNRMGQTEFPSDIFGDYSAVPCSGIGPVAIDTSKYSPTDSVEVRANITITGGNGSDLTQGSFDVWYKATHIEYVAYP